MWRTPCMYVQYIHYMYISKYLHDIRWFAPDPRAPYAHVSCLCTLLMQDTFSGSVAEILEFELSFDARTRLNYILTYI